METVLDAPTPRRRRVGIPFRFLPVGVAFGGIVVGFAAAYNPTLAVVGVLAVACVPVVLSRPIVGLLALLFMSFLEEYAAITGSLSVTKLLGALLALTWLAVVTTRARAADGWSGLLSREPMLVTALVFFAAWASMSLAWAQAPDAAQNSVLRFALNFTLFPIALVAIRAPRHVIWVAAVFVAGALIASTLGLSAGTLDDPAAEGRLKGAGLNPNQLGSYLVVAMVLSVALAANRGWSKLARSAALASAGLAGVGVFLTLSRGALVGMGVALLLAPFLVGPRRRLRALVLVAAAILGAGTWFTTIAPANSVERVTNPERGGGSGREDLWRVGWRMVEDKPVHGVGAGNFPEVSVDYLLRPGATQRDAFIVDEKKVAHNIYLTVLSELGAVGFALFLAIIGICLRSAFRAAHAFARKGDQTMELIARALLISLLSLLAVGFFSSALYVKQFWILLAAAPALLALAERGGWKRAPRAG